MGINGIMDYSVGYTYNSVYNGNAVNKNDNLPVSEIEDITIGEPDKEAKKTARLSSPQECETCKNRKYQDGSNEFNVSFKSAAHISPETAASKVMAHEGEHVSNAYKKAFQNGGKVVSASVSLHTAVCPECGRVYISGGTTNTTIKYSNEENPYVQNQKAIDATNLTGANVDYAA